MDDMDVTDEGNRPTMKTNRRDKIRKQRNAFGESSANNDRSSLKCHRTDFAESSSYEALFEPRLRRHCSEKGKPSSRPSSSSSRQRPSRQRDAAAAAAADTAAEDDVDAGGGGGRCNRSLSCRSRAPLRPTELNFLGAEPRRRTYSMPSKNKRAFIDSAQRQAHQRSSSSSSTPEDFYRVRTFSTSSKGILNKGDSFKRKRRAAAAAAEAEKKGQTTAAAAVVVVEATGKAAKAKKPVPATSAAAAAAAASSSSASVGRSLLQTVSAERSRVLVMGGPGVGKRSIMQQFLTSEYMGTADSTHVFPRQLLDDIYPRGRLINL